MTAVMVLGMHRSGTSLVASMLQALGIRMGDGLKDGGLYEDVDFVHLNHAILKDAGGDWAKVPPWPEIQAAGNRLAPQIQKLCGLKQRDGLWGWKDPRTCLTAGLYLRYLFPDVKIVVVRRDRPDVVQSLIKRDGPADWGRVYDIYQMFVEKLLEGAQGVPVLKLRYEDLTHPKAAPMRVRQLVEFLELEADDVGRAYLEQAALNCIQYRDRWGFGTIGFGTPYYKAQYEFFRWWSWLLTGGFEVGDQLLNGPDLRCEVPIPMAHNGLVVEFLNTDCDTMLILEDDHIGQQDTIRQMRYKRENQRFDIVAASYVNRRPPLTACGFDFKTNGQGKPEVNQYGEYTCVVDWRKVTDEGTQEYQGAVLGVTLIRRWVLEKMLGDESPEDYFWFDWRGRNSQDVQFYARVLEQAGARVGVDRDNPVGHIGKKVWTMDEYYDARNKYLEQQEAANGGTL